MTEINIEGVTFQIKQLFGVYCVFDSTDNMVGRADTLPVAVKICEQIALRRRVDGKVDEPQKAVDENFDEGAIQKSFIVCKCMDCAYYRVFYTNNKVGYCSATSNQYITVSEDYSCNHAKRRT